MIDLHVLKEELEQDPLQLGYSQDDAEAAITLNSLETGRKRDRQTVTAGELLDATDINALANRTDRELYLFELILVSAPILVSSPRIRNMLSALFSGEAATYTRLIALQTEAVSRAVELFNEEVGYWDVAQARELP